MGSNPLPMAIAVSSEPADGGHDRNPPVGEIDPEGEMYAEPADREADQDADEQPPQGENSGAPPEGAFLRVDQVKNRAPAEVAKVLEHDVARDKEPEHRGWVHLGRSYGVGPRPGFSAILSTASFAVLRPVRWISR